MSDGRWECQQAVYAALASAIPSICGGRIFSPAPQNYSTFPYVVIGESDAVEMDTTGTTDAWQRGLEETFTLHVWSRTTSMKEAKQIISQIRDALHDVQLTVAGRSFAYSQVRSDQMFQDPDGITMHGVVQCRVLHHA